MSRYGLAMPASVAASTVKAATAMESASTAAADTAATMESAAAVATEAASNAAVDPATCVAATRAAPVGPTGAIPVSRTAIAISAPIAVSPATVGPPGPAIIAASPAVIPRPRADKHAAHKKVRAIVTVRRAGVRGIPVIAISANGRGAYPGIHRANSNAHPDLRLRVPRAHQQNTQ